MSRIQAPVGPWDDPDVKRKAGNRAADITTVQNLLVAASKSNKAYYPGTPDGKINRVASKSATLKAIFNYQQQFMRRPDQRVDPGGTTLKKLSLTGGGGGGSPPIRTGGTATVRMTNRGSTRSMDITPDLMKKLGQAVGAVFGAAAVASVYSGGQPAKGTSTKRTGTVRHDLGHAADITITIPGGSKVGLAGMEKLGQWWLAKKFGCAGVGMQSGRGIHLDEWNSTTGPKLAAGMGPFWTYASGAGANSKSILRKGHAGQFPK